MKFEVKRFIFLNVIAITLIVLVVVGWSVQGMLEVQRSENLPELRNLWQAQIHQLQQKQRLWLQSQFYVVASLLNKRGQDQQLQSYLWSYYQRNPDISSISMRPADAQPVTKTARSCIPSKKIDPSTLNIIPYFSSCQFEDQTLLEIKGPATIQNVRQILTLQMDYFSFMREFSQLHNLRFEVSENKDGLPVFTDPDFSGSDTRDVELTVAEGDLDLAIIRVHLDEYDVGLTNFNYMMTVVGILILLFIFFAIALNSALLRPLDRLANRMYDAGLTNLEDLKGRRPPVETGLEGLFQSFNVLLSQAKHDAITGLENRIIFEDRLVQSIRDGRRSGRQHALILIESSFLADADQLFSQYHFDALLSELADRLRSSLRESDNISRFDRDLFAVLAEVPDKDQLSGFVDKVFYSLSQPYHFEGQKTELNFKIGIALYPDHGVNANDLYRNASAALKIASGNEWPIQFYRGDDSSGDGFTLIQSLRHAIENNELKLVYQPVVTLANHKTVYFEALLRWKDPEVHQTSIERIIELAEKNQLIKPLTNWIIETACELISELGIDNIVIGINLSMVDLHNESLPGRIERILHKYNVKPAQLTVEVTEGQIMQDASQVSEVLSHIGVMGLSISIDDFGTGQASLTYLKELPVEKLKIDQSFVRDIVTNPDDQLIVKATIEMAHTLDLTVVAEGVETIEVHQALRELNCDYVQGYYVSKPLESDQVAAWLRRDHS